MSKIVTNQVQQKTNALRAQAEQLARTTVDVAKRTALGISLEDAQKQFKAAEGNCSWNGWLWLGLSLTSVCCLLGAIWYFFENPPPENPDWPEVTHLLVLRFAFLSTVGIVCAYCLRSYSAYKHMQQLNAHRKRLANSASAFVSAAYTDSARDRILEIIVNAVANFGVSGLLPAGKEDASMGSISVANIAKETLQSK